MVFLVEFVKESEGKSIFNKIRYASPEKLWNHEDFLHFFRQLSQNSWSEHILVTDWGGGESRKWLLSPLNSSAPQSLCYWDRIANTLFYGGPPHMTLLRFHWSMLWCLKWKCIWPLQKQNRASEKKSRCVLGISIHNQLVFTGANGMFCIELLLNWSFVYKESIFSLDDCTHNVFLKKFARVTDQKALLLV